MDLYLTIAVIVIAFAAGIVGALFGLGGGVIIIPALTIALGFPIKEAIGASLIGVIASSTGAAYRYVSEGLVNIRLGIILEPATTLGSIVGAFIAIYLDQVWLAVAFGFILLYTSYSMLRKRTSAKDEECRPSDLSCEYVDYRTGERVVYDVKNLDKGLIASFGAGNMSGMLGIGGGLIKVPAMNLWMGVPIRAATATSNFMIGVTALAGAVVFYANGMIAPVLAATVAVGVFMGASLGPIISKRTAGPTLRKYFAVLMIAIAVLMFLKAFGFSVGL